MVFAAWNFQKRDFFFLKYMRPTVEPWTKTPRDLMTVKPFLTILKLFCQSASVCSFSNSMYCHDMVLTLSVCFSLRSFRGLEKPNEVSELRKTLQRPAAVNVRPKLLFFVLSLRLPLPCFSLPCRAVCCLPSILCGLCFFSCMAWAKGKEVLPRSVWHDVLYTHWRVVCIMRVHFVSPYFYFRDLMLCAK